MDKRLPTKPAASYIDPVTEKLRSTFLVLVFADQGYTVGTQKRGNPEFKFKNLQRFLMQLSMQKHKHISCTMVKGFRCQCLLKYLVHIVHNA